MPKPPIAVRVAATTLAWESTAPRGTTSTAAVEITAKGSSGATSADGDLARRPGTARRTDVKPGPAGSPN